MAGPREKIEHYRSRAEELRGLAEQMRSPMARDLLLKTADDYDRLARSLEKRDSRSG
jgi:hypothetical protein